MHVIAPEKASRCRSKKVQKEVGLRRFMTVSLQISNEIAQRVIEAMKEKANVHEHAESTAKRIVGQSVTQNWDCSQNENEEEEEEEDWQEKDQIEVPWAEDEKLEEVFERRRMERSSLQAEVMQKVTELVVRERKPQSKGVKV